MVKQLKPVGRIQVHAERGLTRFQLTDGSETFEVELPVEPFLTFAGRLYQGMLSAKNNDLQGGARPDRRPVMLPKEFEVGVLEVPQNPSVVIVLDGGTDAELSFAIPVHQASAVADGIKEKADAILKALPKA